MEHTIEFGEGPPDVTVTTSGQATADGLVAMVTDVAEHPRYEAGSAILVDHTALDATTLDAGDIRAVAEAVVRLDAKLGPSRVAILVPDPLTFGYARMYELLADPAQIRSRVFYAHDEALRWLAAHVAPGAEAT